MAATQTTRKFAVGDLVTLHPAYATAKMAGRVFRIKKLPVGSNGVNYIAEPVNGGVGIKAPEHMFLAYEGVVMETNPMPVMGQIVRVQGLTDLYVALGESRKGGVKVTKLGGDGNRYYPHVSLAKVTIVPTESVVVG